MASTSGSQHRCVFVGNIPYDATEEQLIQICEEVGPVVSFRLVLDKETGRPKGYGFCEYKDEETALSARRNLQGYEINGRQLRVDFAENDKGVDRNREQGRGGPGFASATDSHKSLSGPPFVGDGALHQPLGFPLAATAASLMAEAFGGPQMTSNLPKFGNGMPNVPDSSYDPLTAHLAKMSRQHLYDVLSEMKALVTRNRAQARQLLQESPQLTKALLQAQIILGMATPQMILAAGIQKTSSAVAKYSGQDNKHDLAPYIGYVTSNNEAGIETFLRPSEGQENNVLPDSAIIPQSSLPPKPIPFHVYRPHMPQNQVSAQGMIPGIGGAYMHSNIQAPPLTTSRCSLSQVQPSLMYHSRPVGTPNIIHQSQGIQPHTSMHQSSLPPLTSQITLNQPVLLSGVEMLSNDVRSSGSNLHLSCVSRISSQPSSADFVLQNEMPSGTTELLNHTLKRRRLEEGGIVHNFIGGKSSLPGISSSQPSDSSLLAGREISNTDGLQKTHQQMPQLSAAEESALLQQLLSLTAEQLSSLPLEQQQQVFEIQNTLRSKPHI